MYLPYMYQSPQKSQITSFSEHSTIASAKNPNIRLDVKELFRELERDYGSNGDGLPFGSTLIPLFRDAQYRIPSGTTITVSQFNEILRATGTFDFISLASKDRQKAISEIVQMSTRLGATV